MHADYVNHSFAIARIAAERTHAFGDARGLGVGFAGHQRGDGAAEIATAVGIVRKRERHQQRTQVGVTDAQRTVVVRIARDFFRGIAGVVHQNFLRGDGDVHGVGEGVRVELAVGAQVLHQVERSQVASRIVQEHVLRARIGRVDAVGGFAGVPAVHGSVVLHAGIAAAPRGIRHFAQQVSRAELFARFAVVNVASPPTAVFLYCPHEIVGDAHGVIGVLKEDGGVSLAVNRGIVTLFDQHVVFALFLGLGLDELHDVRMFDVEDDHFGGAARLATALDDAGKGVKALHEAHRAGSDAAAGERFPAAAQGGEVRAGAGAPLEEHAFGLGQVHDGIHVVLDGIDEAGGALRLGLHANVEPDRGIEGDFLLDEQVGEFVAENILGFNGGEVAAFIAPADDGVYHAADQDRKSVV